MADTVKKLAWFVGIWAMSVVAILAVGYAIRLMIAP